LVGASTLDANEAIKPTHDTGKQRQGVLEVLVEGDDRFENFGVKCRGAAGAGGEVDAGVLSIDGDGFCSSFLD
jgi:hypothetical protein